VGPVSLRVRLLLALAYVLLLAVIALEVPLALGLRDRVDNEVRASARAQADIAAASVAGQLDDQEEVDRVAATTAETARGRVIIVDERGIVLADEPGAERVGADYSTRPEIATALRGGVYQEERRSDTLNETILATAVPVVSEGQTEGAVRITQSVAAVERAIRSSIVGLAAIGLLVLLLGLAAGALIAGQIAGPLRRLDATARRIAAGDLSVRAKIEGSAEQQRLARTFNDMTARLERLIGAQREFVADASHQLRTPLSGLRLRLEEARAVTSEPEAHEEIDAGLAELDRLSAIVSELLLLSQAGEADAPSEPVDLAAAARRAVSRFDGRVTLAETSDGGPPAWCSPADLDRVLDALIENGLNYGGGQVVVRARPGAVEVLDDGPGLAPDELEAVFERFHRGRAGRAGPAGTGLGLPIARELARRWGGDVEMANRREGGAAATVRFPSA
jgi:signal transduction histidine kinase